MRLVDRGGEVVVTAIYAAVLIVILVFVSVVLFGCTSAPMGHGEVGIGYNAQHGMVFVYSKAYLDEQDAQASFNLQFDQWVSDWLTRRNTQTESTEAIAGLEPVPPLARLPP